MSGLLSPTLSLAHAGDTCPYGLAD